MSGIKLARAMEAAQTAARAAGRFIQDSRKRIVNAAVEHKAPAEVALAIEREAAALIASRIGAVFPEHGFIGGSLGGTIDARRVQWLVDPIDGGANYRHGYPQYATSLALQHQGEVVLGVIYDPNRDELFTATRGQSASCNGVKVACAAPTRAAEAIVATIAPPLDSQKMTFYLAEFERMSRGVGDVRRSGALALDLAWLAAGRIDAFWAHDIGAWDAAAAVVLLREAGARFEALDRAPLLASRSLLVATPAFFATARTLLVEPVRN
jgi:myo-inositol-1(or 4)-monophosphatase